MMTTGLDENAREEMLGKMIRFRETKPSAESKSCKDSSTLSGKIKTKKVKTKIYDKIEPNFIIKGINIHKTIIVPESKCEVEEKEAGVRRSESLGGGCFREKFEGDGYNGSS